MQRKLRAIQLHMLMYNWTCKHTNALITSTTPGLHSVSIHQTSPIGREIKHPITAYYSIYRPRKDERLRWPSWLTCSKRFTHINGHPSAEGRAQDRESSPAKDRRSATVPCHQLHIYLVFAENNKMFQTLIKQGVAITGRNTTGPPSRATPWWVTLHMWVLQTTTTDDDRRQRPLLVLPLDTMCRCASNNAQFKYERC